MNKNINSFYEDVKDILTSDCKVFTTNFDYLADDILKPNHIHGQFIKCLNKYSDVFLVNRNEKENYFKYIWGWNGIGKMNFIYELEKLSLSSEFFNFDFFFQDIKINNLLIFGIGFQRSGYITNEFLEEHPKYNKELVGSVIDEHILIRIKGMQNKELLKRVTISYFSEEEKEHFKKLLDYYKIENYSFIKVKNFKFKVS